MRKWKAKFLEAYGDMPEGTDDRIEYIIVRGVYRRAWDDALNTNTTESERCECCGKIPMLLCDCDFGTDNTREDA